MPSANTPKHSSGGSSYLDLVDRLTGRYPILFYLTKWARDQPRPSTYPARVEVLEFHQDIVQHVCFKDKKRSNYEQLADYLANSTPDTCKRRLYLVEDLDVPHLELLGEHLNVDGTVFASYIRDTHWTDGSINGISPQLPSFKDPHTSFTLKYYELRAFQRHDMLQFSSKLHTIGNVSRRIAFGRGNKHGPVGLIRRNTSYWSKLKDDGSWNGMLSIFVSVQILIGPGILLLDPPVSCATFTYASKNGQQKWLQVESYPFQKGYRDTTPWPDISTLLSKEDIRGPYRSSLLDDICFYWTSRASQSQIHRAIEDPYESSIFLRNIVASIWLNMLEHIHSTLSVRENGLRDIEDMTSPEISEAKKNGYLSDFTRILNELNTMRRRGNWYLTEMKINLEALGMSPDFLSLTSQQTEQNHDHDFIAIYARLQTYQAWAERYIDLISTMMTTIETRKSLADSRSLSRLTVLGFAFLPVSFVATFFSMGGDFAVGQKNFWVYFAVALPVSLIVFLFAFIKWRNLVHNLVVWWKQKRNRARGVF